VAIVELLIGFSIDPSSRGAVNRQPNSFPPVLTMRRP
jgi:hypothetical protein